MAEYRRSRSFWRWHGQLSVLTDVCRFVQATFADWSDKKMQYDIELRFDKGFSQETDNLAEVDELPPRDLQRLQKLRVRVTPAGWTMDPHFVIEVERGTPAVWYLLTGTDRSRVEGLASRIEDALSPNEQWPRVPQYIIGTVSFLGLLVAALFAMDEGLTLVQALHWASVNGRWDPAELAVFPVAAVVALGMWIATLRITADLELIGADGLSQGRRLWSVVVGVVVGVALSIAGSAIWSVLDQPSK
jgi:hypothetical protein